MTDKAAENYELEVEVPWITEGEKARILRIDETTRDSLEEAVGFCIQKRKEQGSELTRKKILSFSSRDPYEVHVKLRTFDPFWMALRNLWKTQKFLDAYSSGNEDEITKVHKMEDCDELVAIDHIFGFSATGAFIGNNLPGIYHNEGLCTHFRKLLHGDRAVINDLGSHAFIENLREKSGEAYKKARNLAIELVKNIPSEVYEEKEFIARWFNQELKAKPQIIEVLKGYEEPLCLTYRLLDRVYSNDDAGELRFISPHYFACGKRGWPSIPSEADIHKESEEGLQEWKEKVMEMAGSQND